MTLIVSDNSCGKDMNELWYRRMEHLHHGALNMLKKIVPRVPKLSTKHDDVFRGCVLRKYAKATFPRSVKREDGVLGIIHSDICGMMSTRSLSGAKYVITFIGDHSRKTCTYFFKTKDEAFNHFKEFKVLMENVIGKKIKVL